jgi:hypothetical protein
VTPSRIRRTAMLLLLGCGLVLSPGVGTAKRSRVVVIPPPYLFADIAWQTPADSALKSLADHGYREVRAAHTDSSRQAEGRLFNQATIVTASLDDQRRVIRWVVRVLAPPKESKYGESYTIMRKVYDDMVLEANAKYGMSERALDRYRFPYARGDGLANDALRNGCATIRTEWFRAGAGSLAIEMEPSVAVVLSYTSPAWQAVEAQRRGKKAKDL